jgi:hypothetical protein
MNIIAKCPRCGTAWSLDSSAADRRFNCGQCGRLFKVPAMKDVPKAERILRDAQAKLYIDEEGRTYG